MIVFVFVGQRKRNSLTRMAKRNIMTISHMTIGHSKEETMPKKTFLNLTEEKKKRILDAAILEFSKNHYRKVTIDNIIEKAEIPKGSFYQYFLNKDDLYEYIFEQIGDDKKQVLDRILEKKQELSFGKYVIEMLKEAALYEKNNDTLQNLRKRFLNECPQELRKKVLQEVMPKGYHVLETAVKAYMEKGELRQDLNPYQVSYVLSSAILNMEYYECMDRKKEELQEEMIELLLQGIKK